MQDGLKEVVQRGSISIKVKGVTQPLLERDWKYSQSKPFMYLKIVSYPPVEDCQIRVLRQYDGCQVHLLVSPNDWNHF